MLFLTPALVAPELPPGASFDFAQFRDTRLLRDSSPELIRAFERLHQDSPTFAALVARFAREEPEITLSLLKNEGKTFGTLVVKRTPGSYHITLGVQTKLARLGMDAVEPWLAALVFALREVCRNERAHYLAEGNFQFTPEVTEKSARFQDEVRIELKRSTSLPRLVLDPFWPRAFRRHVLGIKDVVRQMHGGG